MKVNLPKKAILSIAVFAFVGIALLLIFKKIEKSLGEYQRLTASFTGSEKEHRRHLSGRDTRMWKTPPCDFFKTADLNELCEAIADANERKVEVLLERNLDLNEVGVDGMTVLFFAYMEGEYPGFIRLLAKGAKPDVPLTKKQEVLQMRIPVNEGETVMFAACRNPSDRYRFILPALTHADNINLQDSRGHTVLHQLMGLGGPTGESVLFVIKDSGIDPMIKDNAGKTARDYAIEIAPQLVPMFDLMIEKATAKGTEAPST